MRNLTIKRTKSFVACLVKMKVYIENPAFGDTLINNVPCSKIGELKNGEEKTFVIGENEAKVYVVADQLSKNYCNDFYKLTAGTEDVYLSGKNRYNPASGNAFRFDGVVDEEILHNRKKGTKKGLIVLVAAIVIGGIVGYSLSSVMLSSTPTVPKEFTYDDMTITLTDNFVEKSMDGFTVCYDSSDIAVFVLKESFDLLDGSENYTLEEYGELVLQSNSFDSELQSDNGLTYFEYEFTNPDNNETYTYFSSLYKTSDAFWMIQFTTPEDYKSYRDTFIEWAKSVKFTN